MDDDYDMIILGTGLKECILSGLFSLMGKKILHLDRNDYYGGEIASVTPLTKFFTDYLHKDLNPKLGKPNEWYVDLINKLIMANGHLAKLLIHTKVTNYVEFGSVDGSYVYISGSLHRVPSTIGEAAESNIMGFFQKRKFKQLLEWVHHFDIKKPKTYESVINDPSTDCFNTIYDYFGINEDAQEFIGHAICLYSNDDYKTTQSVVSVVGRIQLYVDSMSLFGGSPYLYPFYGLGELPQGFARLSAVFGGTSILRQPVDEIVMNKSGRVSGVRHGKTTAKCSVVICDPSYLPHKCRQSGKVVRAICILDHPIENTEGCLSCQIILPQKQINRQHDIYISCVSYSMHTASVPYFIVSVSTEVETEEPEKELSVGLQLLHPILHTYTKVSTMYQPTDDGRHSQVFCTSSYDASSHFESACQDVLDVYARITGRPFDFDQVKDQIKGVVY